MTYTVGEMAEIMGVAPSTLRYYDKEGLLPFVERTGGGSRVFKDSDYEGLKVIEYLKRTGLSIKEIRNFIDMAMEGDATIDARLALFEERGDTILLAEGCSHHRQCNDIGTVKIPRWLKSFSGADFAVQIEGEKLPVGGQRNAAVEKQIAQMQETLALLNFKCWYYQTAKAAGTEAVVKGLGCDTVPSEHKGAKRTLYIVYQKETQSA